MFLETSAKTAFNVVEAFNLSAQAILQNVEKNGVDASTTKQGVKLGPKEDKEKAKTGCC